MGQLWANGVVTARMQDLDLFTVKLAHASVATGSTTVTLTGDTFLCDQVVLYTQYIPRANPDPSPNPNPTSTLV